MDRDVAEKLLPLMKKKYPHLSEDEALAMAERFSNLSVFLVGLHVKKQQQKPELGED